MSARDHKMHMDPQMGLSAVCITDCLPTEKKDSFHFHTDKGSKESKALDMCITTRTKP